MKVLKSIDKIIIYVSKDYLKDEIYSKVEYEELIKNVMIKLKKRYNEDIQGFYEAVVYENKNYGFIVELTKDGEIDLFKDLIDLKVIIKKDEDFLLEWDDYFLIKDLDYVYYYGKKYYTSINLLDSYKLKTLSEHYKVIYGSEKENIKKRLKEKIKNKRVKNSIY